MSTATEEQKQAARARMQQVMATQQAEMQMKSLAQQRENLVTSNVLKILKGVEEKMDQDIQELQKVEELNEADLDALRDRRRQQMKNLAAKKTEWRLNGHGEYREVRGEKEFFAEVKSSKRVVVHFFRRSTFRCNIVDRHLSDLAKNHLETKFIKIDAEKSPFLVERLKIWMMPSILVCIDGKTSKTIMGFEEFGNCDDFSTKVVASVLENYGAVHHVDADDQFEEKKQQEDDDLDDW